MQIYRDNPLVIVQWHTAVMPEFDLNKNALEKWQSAGTAAIFHSSGFSQNHRLFKLCGQGEEIQWNSNKNERLH